MQYEMIAENPYQHTSDDVFSPSMQQEKASTKKKKKGRIIFQKVNHVFALRHLQKDMVGEFTAMRKEK